MGAPPNCGGTSFWVHVPGQVGNGQANHLSFLLQEPDPFARLPLLSGLRHRWGGQAVGDSGLLHPVVHRGPGDAEVLRNLGPLYRGLLQSTSRSSLRAM